MKKAAERTPTAAIRIPNNAEQGHTTQDAAGFTRYGSILGSPTFHPPSRPATLNLPEAAMSSGSLNNHRRSSVASSCAIHEVDPIRPSRGAPQRTMSNNAFEVGKTRHPYQRGISFTGRRLSVIGQTQSKRLSDSQKPLLQRMFSNKHASPKISQTSDVPMEALQDINKKDEQFTAFLDAELEKIETFYKSKEDEASKRLNMLRQQLHVMRDQRLDEVMELERRREHRKRQGSRNMQGLDELNMSKDDILAHPGHIQDVPHALDLLYHPIQAAKQVHFTKKPRNPNIHTTPPAPAQNHSKDYTRRPSNPNIPYLTAKRKLKTALQEFYRGLELLKSYTLLNRTAFRKINKKYDKAVVARPTMRYVNENVNNAHFVQSTVVDGYLTAVEDLYARYFEKGSHKIAVGKLRKKNLQAGSYTGSVFRNGLTAGIGLVFGIEALVKSADLCSSKDFVIANNTSYLLQVGSSLSPTHFAAINTSVALWGLLLTTLSLSLLLFRLSNLS